MKKIEVIVRSELKNKTVSVIKKIGVERITLFHVPENLDLVS